MDAMHEICEKFKDELEEFARQDKFTSEDIRIIDAITHTIKSIATIKAMEGSGYSYRTYRASYNRDGRGGSYGEDEWEREHSERSMRGGRDGYNYRTDRYSRDDSRDMLLKYAEKIMSHTDDAEVKRAAQALMAEIDKA